jgi:hypothetical protein
VTRIASRLDFAAVHRRLRRAADRIGPVGMIGVAILATCAGYYAGSIEPQRRHLALLRDGGAVAEAPRAARGPAHDTGRQLLQFAADFPDERQLASLLGRLYALGEREGVRLSQGEYRFVEPDALGMVQYKIVLPVVASYPALRRFVAATLTEMPSLAVTQINLQRDRIGQGQVDARLELTLHLRGGSALTAGEARTPSDLSRASEVNR